MTDLDLTDWLVIAISNATRDDDDGSVFSFESIRLASAAPSDEEHLLGWERVGTPIEMNISPDDSHASFETNVLALDISEPKEESTNNDTTRVATIDGDMKSKAKKKEQFSSSWPEFPWHGALESPTYWMRHRIPDWCYPHGDCDWYFHDGSTIMRSFVHVPVRSHELEQSEECEVNVFWLRNNGSNLPSTTPSIVALSLDSKDGGVLVEIQNEMFWWRNGSLLAVMGPTVTANILANETKPVHEPNVGAGAECDGHASGVVDDLEHHHDHQPMANSEGIQDDFAPPQALLDPYELNSTFDSDETDTTSVDSNSRHDYEILPAAWRSCVLEDDCMIVYHC